jgi:hypothetical protein
MYLEDTGAAASAVANPVSHDNATGINLRGAVNVTGGSAYHNSSYGVQGYRYSFETIDGIVVYENARGIYLGQGEVLNARVYGNDGYGILADYTTARVRGSVIYGNDVGVRFTNYYGSIELANNLIYGNAAGAVVFSGALSSGESAEVVNNTIYQEAGDAIHIASTQRVHLRNNILVSGGYGVYVAADSQVGFTSNCNLFHPLPGGSVGYWQGARAGLADWQFATFLDGDSPRSTAPTPRTPTTTSRSPTAGTATSAPTATRRRPR